ncbi:hypothetical protein [Aquimarina latercula]|uniref:hypothetical protein n=1 Tax=Aquimarina latercula TaxID=987 RepID=UPI0004253675|nr:hypothetical protein [Aquimarina latercula]
MIEYPIAIDENDTSEYDPFLHHVIRHKLRKKKNRRRLKKLFRKHPKTRILRSIGIGRKRRRTRPVGRPIRTLDKRYRRPIGRPDRNRQLSRQGTIKKPFRMPPIKFGNPIHRDLEQNRRISKIGIRKPLYKGTPIMPGDPSNRRKPPISVPNKKGRPKVSKDIVIPYKRRYGSRKGSVAPVTPRRSSKEAISTLEEELPIVAQDMIASNMEVIDEKEQKPEKPNNKRKMQNIIGVVALGLVVTGFVLYKMKMKTATNGRTS